MTATRETKGQRAQRFEEYLLVHRLASEAGDKAHDELGNVPLYQAKDETTGYTYPEPFELCGFGWVVVTPATKGYGKWLKDRGYADKHYYGGVSIWVTRGNQGYERKVAWARAYADEAQRLLDEAGYEADADTKLYGEGRLD